MTEERRNRTLLLVHHTTSPGTEAMLEAVREGTSAEGIEGVSVVLRPALTASAVDVLSADGYLFGTPANIGYMSGALKHFFDTVYYPCREATQGRPYGLFVHGNQDLAGALRSVEQCATGMGLVRASADVECRGEVTREVREACWELGATLAAALMDS